MFCRAESDEDDARAELVNSPEVGLSAIECEVGEMAAELAVAVCVECGPCAVSQRCRPMPMRRALSAKEADRIHPEIFMACQGFAFAGTGAIRVSQRPAL